MRKPGEDRLMRGILRTCPLVALMLVLVFAQSDAQPVGGYGTVQTRGSGTDEITLLKVGGTRFGGSLDGGVQDRSRTRGPRAALNSLCSNY